jgi:hypothetical protein
MNRRLEGGLILLAMVGLVAGGLVGWHAWQQWTMYSLGDATPRPVRLADLERDGPGNNIHVRVTDFFLPPNYVAEKKNDKWNRVWIPMLPRDQPGRREIKVVARAFDIENEFQLQQFYRQPEVTGIVVNAIWGIRSQEAEHLKTRYPGSDFSSAILIDAGRAFPTKEGVALWIGVASGLLALGLFATVLSVVLKIRSWSV